MNLTGLNRFKKTLLKFAHRIEKKQTWDKKLKTKAAEEFRKNIQKYRDKKNEEAKIVYVNIHLKAVNENALIWSFCGVVVCMLFDRT